MGLFSTPQTQSVDPVELARQQVRAREQENLIGRASLNPTQTIGLLYGQAGRSLGRAIEKLSGYEDPLITRAKKQKQMDSMLTARDKFLITESTRLNIPIGGTEFYNLARKISPQFNLPGTDVTKHQLLNADAVTKVDEKDRQRLAKNQIALLQPQAPENQVVKEDGDRLRVETFVVPDEKIDDETIATSDELKAEEERSAESVGITEGEVGETPSGAKKVFDSDSEQKADSSEIDPALRPDFYRDRITATKNKIAKVREEIKRLNNVSPDNKQPEFVEAQAAKVKTEQDKIKELEGQISDDRKAIRSLAKDRYDVRQGGDGLLYIFDKYDMTKPPVRAEIPSRMKLFGQTGLLTRPEVVKVNGTTTYETAFYETVKKDDGTFEQKRLSSKEVAELQKDGTVPTPNDILAEKIAEEAAKGLNEQYKNATDVRMAQNAVHQAMRLLDGGIMTGTKADNRLAIDKLRELTDFTPDEVDAMLARTETYQAVVGQLVGQIIKLFGAGTGLSDADRDYATLMAGGKIESLAAILQYHDTRLAQLADVWDKGYGAVLEGNAKKIYTLPVVEDYEFKYDVLPEMLRSYEQKREKLHQKKYDGLE
mgnify:FL=1